MTPSQRYENYLLRKKFAESGVEDLSGPIGEGVAETDWLGRSNLTQNEGLEAASSSPKMSSGANAGVAGAQTAIQGGSPLDIATSAGMASGNPYAVGAALGLGTISAINKSKQQREQNRYLAELQRVKARQDAIDRLASIGQNLRA